MIRKLLHNVIIISVLITVASGAYAAETNAAASAENQTIEFEYNGKVIKVQMTDLILLEDGSITINDPEKYADQLGDSLYGENTDQNMNREYDESQLREINTYTGQQARTGQGGRAITEQEYEEEKQAQRWLDVVNDLEIRDIDQKALDLVKEFHGAKNGVAPSLGQTGSVVFAYQTYIPKVLCRPMYVTDIILEPGELVNGVHPGDTARWIFVPGEVGEGANKQISVLVKPLMPDISTNLVIMTTKRRYNINLMSSATEYMPSVSFTYPADALREWDSFITTKREEKTTSAAVADGYDINPEDIHLNYKIEGKDNLRWKPVSVYDDGVKTYIKFPAKSAIKSVEAPIFVVFEKKREIIVNYRFALNDMMIIDKVFDVGALIVGTGSAQSRVTIRRLKGK
jgi:type IV secretion system protein VirB9